MSYLFELLVSRLQNCSSPQERQKLLETAADHHVFTCHQLGVILMSLNYPSERRTVTGILAPVIVDPENAADHLRPFLACDSSCLRTEILKMIMSNRVK